MHNKTVCLTHRKHYMPGIWALVATVLRWILMVNNNNLLSFGLRCGDSVTFLFCVFVHWEKEKVNCCQPEGGCFVRKQYTYITLNHIAASTNMDSN